MNIRRAREGDRADIEKLLLQVCMVHHQGRPDLFRPGGMKYTKEELLKIIHDDERPIFVAADDSQNVIGYVFCMFQQHIENNIMTDIKTLYIDDLCVDETIRGKHIGKALYDYVLEYAKKSGCYNVTLNVWSCNETAMQFYEKCGLSPFKTGMEKIL